MLIQSASQRFQRPQLLQSHLDNVGLCLPTHLQKAKKIIWQEEEHFQIQRKRSGDQSSSAERFETFVFPNCSWLASRKKIVFGDFSSFDKGGLAGTDHFVIELVLEESNA